MPTCFLILVLLLPGAAPDPAAAPAAPGPVRGLQIRLSTDRENLSPGEEIRLRIQFSNLGRSKFRIFEDRTFVGSEIVVTGPGGRSIPFDGGFLTFSPKSNQYLGGTLLLKPGEKRELVMDAYLDRSFRLVFASRSPGPEGEALRSLRARHGLPSGYPARYISSGRIFPLAKPGRYTLRFHYQKDEADRHWTILSDVKEETSTRNIWEGTAESNSVELKIEP